ncbi:MAG: UTP--glucose-1-phosphate uridylyltransferase [Candidatus Lindowbacteria bacterium]|nr:UTP--glucose-1-phosphate uridylyltransferase [Candidatus Lindowbacteria bacterium]
MSDKRQVKKAVFPVTGAGTRFLPVTKSIPKELLPVYDRPAIHLVLQEAVRSGIEEILFVTSPSKSAIPNYLSSNGQLDSFLNEKGKSHLLKETTELISGAAFQYVNQEKALGLGHAVLCAKEFVGDEPFFVYLPDDIIFTPNGTPTATTQMMDVFEETQGSVIALEAVPDDRVSGYGVISGPNVKDGLYQIDDVVEKPKLEDAPSNLTIVGRYVFTSAIFGFLEETQEGSGGEIQLTDAILELLKNEKVYGLECVGRRYDTGNPAGMLTASIEYGLRSDDSEAIKEALRALDLS